MFDTLEPSLTKVFANVACRCFLRLEAPIQRLASWDTPFPLVFEKFHLPDMIRCAEGIERVMKF